MASAAETKPYHEPAIPFAEQRSELRAEFGRRVGDKLDNTPGLWRMTHSRERPVQLYVRSAFLTPAECVGLARQIDSSSYPSPLYEKEKHEGVRTSYSCNLNVYDPLVAEVDTRIAALLGIDRGHGEPLQGQRYQTGQEFKQHADFFYIDQPYWEQYGKQGGQRTWTR
jgi:prolyl 4-hydroxylase